MGSDVIRLRSFTFLFNAWGLNRGNEKRLVGPAKEQRGTRPGGREEEE